LNSPVRQQSLEPFIFTLIVCEAVDELPHESVAVQVLVTEYEPAHEPLVVTSAEVNVKAEPQASVAVATANTGVAGQSIVEVAGRLQSLEPLYLVLMFVKL
jgi:hypothetical protein